ARYLAARLLAQSGDASDAATRLRAIANASPPAEDSAAAAYAIADMEADHGDDAGWSDLRAVATRFPASGVARRALERWAEHEDQAKGARATIAELDALAPSLDATELGETVHYLAARRL